MTAYRFCRTDDIGLLVTAYEACRGPEDRAEPTLDRAGFKQLVRRLDLWCSSCMVALEGRDPVGVLLGAKRVEETLVYGLRVHPAHRRRGHGRHLLTSLGQKLAILGPPRLVAEVPADRTAAVGAFEACGWRRERELRDWHRAATVGHGAPALSDAFAEATLADLEGEGILSTPASCWQRDAPALAKADGIAALLFHSLERIEAWTVFAPAASGVLRLLRLGSTPGALGRAGLGMVIDALAPRAPGGLLFERASAAETPPALLYDLGFAPGAGYIRFATEAKPA